jgi:hypothetical protein
MAATRSIANGPCVAVIYRFGAAFPFERRIPAIGFSGIIGKLGNGVEESGRLADGSAGNRQRRFATSGLLKVP